MISQTSLGGGFTWAFFCIFLWEKPLNSRIRCNNWTYEDNNCSCTDNYCLKTKENNNCIVDLSPHPITNCTVSHRSIVIRWYAQSPFTLLCYGTFQNTVTKKKQLRKVVCANHLRSRVRRQSSKYRRNTLPNRAVTIYQSFQLPLLSLIISITSISPNVSYVINMA